MVVMFKHENIIFGQKFYFDLRKSLVLVRQLWKKFEETLLAVTDNA